MNVIKSYIVTNAAASSGGVLIPDASPTTKGIAKLYNDLSGSNTDGAVTQAGVKAVTDDLQDQIDDLGGYTSTPPSVLFGSITGQTMIGKTLTANYSFEDVDGTAEGSSTIQWYYADDEDGTNEVLISGATAFTHTLSDVSMVGKHIGFKITPVNASAESGAVFTYYSPETVSAKLYPGDAINAISASSVKAIVSTKKMFAAYGGSALQLTTNGTTTYEMGFVGDEADWAGAVTWSGGAQLYVKIGYDQSGNSNNLTFANFAAMPKIDLVNKYIVWEPTKSGNCGSHSSLDIGTSNYSIFFHLYINTLKDSQVTIIQKQTNFSTDHISIQSVNGIRYDTYSGDGAPSLKSYNVPLNRWDLLMIGRDGTNRHFKAVGKSFSAAESNNDVTSTGNLQINSGSNGGGDMLSTTMIYATAYGGSIFSDILKFIQHEQA